ncbi:hypothetical protein FEP87_00222 [Burkholderia multivorans]|nr:hypothetical protein [Burkholderia multivorans]
MQPLRVGRDHARRACAFGDERDALRMRGRAELARRVVHDARDVDRRTLQTQLAGRKRRRVEQIADHPRERTRAAIDRVDRLLREALSVDAAQHLDPAVDHVQRRAQFMRHGREQFVLQPVRRVGLHTGVARAAQRQAIAPLVATALARLAQRHREAVDMPVRIDDRRCRKRRAKAVCVLPHAQHVDRPDRRVYLVDRRGHRLTPQPARREQRRYIAADHRRRVGAEDALRRAVPADDPPRAVDADDRIGRRIDHAAQQHVLGWRRCSRRLPACVARVVDRTRAREQRPDGCDQRAFDHADRDERAGVGQPCRRRRVAPPERSDHDGARDDRGEAAGERRQPRGGGDACIKRQRRKRRMRADHANRARLQRARDADGQHDPCTLPE